MHGNFFAGLHACHLHAGFPVMHVPGRVPYITRQMPEVVTVAKIGKKWFVKYNFMKKLS